MNKFRTLATPSWYASTIIVEELIEFDTYAAAEAFVPNSAPTSIRILGYFSPGDYGGGLYKKVLVQPTHFGKLFITLLGGGVVWYELAEPIITPQMLGGIQDGVTVNTTILTRTIGVGRPVFIPVGTFVTNVATASADNVEIFGSEGSILQSSTPDTAILSFTSISNINIHDLTFIGASAATAAAQSEAIRCHDCNNITIRDLMLLNWIDCGIRIYGTASTNTVSKSALIERVTMKDSQSPQRFAGSSIFIGEHTQDFTVQNSIFDGSNAGIIIQNSQNTYNYHLKGHKVLNNQVRNMQQYGIIAYGAEVIHVVTNAVDNGAGLIRITSAGHDLTTGDEVSIDGVVGTIEANGTWLVTVINANTLDLQGSAFVNAYVSDGTFERFNPSDIEFAGNVIEDIDGSPTVTNGMNGNFGAGIYCVGINNMLIHDNCIRRTNLGTTASSLAPAGVGIGGCIGEIKIYDNIIEDCGWRGIYGVSSPYANFQVTDNKCLRNALVGIYMVNIGGACINGNHVETKKLVAGSAGIRLSIILGLVQKVMVNNNKIVGQYCTQILSLSDVNNFLCSGNMVLNLAPNTVICEAVKFTTCTYGNIVGNEFNGGVSTYQALTLTDCTNCLVSGNYNSMTDSVAARPCVTITGTCTGTVYSRDNSTSIDRMENSSTGGTMHTLSVNNLSGNKTRSTGDTIQNTNLSAGAVAFWGKVAQSAAGADWRTLTYS